MLAHLKIKQLCLFLHEWLHSLLDLLFDNLGQSSLDRLRNSLLDLNLQVLLRLHLLLQAVHLRVQLGKLLVKLHVVLHDLLLLLFFGGRHGYSLLGHGAS